MLILVYHVNCYQFPSAYPSIDQTVMIDGSFLTDPVILASIDQVKTRVADKSLLSIKPSIYKTETPSSPAYVDDPVKNCYWPTNQCTKSANPTIKQDITNCPGNNQWGITFDDGPTQNIVNGDHTDDSVKLQQTLDHHNIKATFFIVGSNAIQFPQIITRQFNAGHQIALHTWTHHPLTSLTNEQIVAELKYTESVVYNATKVVPTLVRPPYGDIDDRVRAIIQAMGYQIVLWSKDSTDADQPDTSASSMQKVQQIIKSWFVPQPGFISLEHDISTFSTRIAIKALDEFFSRGYPLKPMPVAACLKQPFYSNDQSSSPGQLPSITATATKDATSTFIPTTSTFTNNNGPQSSTLTVSLSISIIPTPSQAATYIFSNLAHRFGPFTALYLYLFQF